MSSIKTAPMIQVPSDTSISSASPSASSSEETEPKRNVWQRARGFFGFSKTYNFILFVIFAGAMLGFSLARMQYLSVGTGYRKGSAPGEWYWFSTGHYRIGITLHLSTVIPAAFLMVWQFVPAIRRRWILFHRINGWLVIVLLMLGNVGGLMIARRAFGGPVATQTAVGLLAILTSIGMFMAIYNIKHLQLEQHRAWMLRTMFWMGTIITTRLVAFLAAQIISRIGDYYTLWSCRELGSLFSSQQELRDAFPQCFSPNGTVDGMVAVSAKFTPTHGGAEIGSSLRTGFAAALWLAIFLHTVGVEIYLRLTPREHERLRRISYERQNAAGFKHPGSAGLTVDRWGDADAWVPPVEKARR